MSIDDGWKFLDFDDDLEEIDNLENGEDKDDDGIDILGLFHRATDSGSFHGPDGSWGYINDDGSGSYHGADGSWGNKEADGSGTYHGADGSWGYINADGSGAYYGADGSWGNKEADGSGTYHGADGSWGNKETDGSGSYHGANGSWADLNADGSGTYHGADGSWGYRDADGSRTYHGADGSFKHIDADSDDNSDSGYHAFEDNSDKDPSFAAGLADFAFKVGAAVVARSISDARDHDQDIDDLIRDYNNERKHQEQERILEEQRRIEQVQKEEKRNQRNKRIKAFIFNKKNITLEFATTSFVGNNVDWVVREITEAGFNKYTLVPIKDIYVDSSMDVGDVEQVVINGQSNFAAGTQVPYDAKITISYHAKKEFAFPYSARQMVKKNLDVLANELIEIGFTKVYVYPLKDLTTGWIKKDKEVQDVSIVGVDSIKKGMIIEYDRKIVIRFHSFKNR